jgi:hypothetical protein
MTRQERIEALIDVALEQVPEMAETEPEREELRAGLRKWQGYLPSMIQGDTVISHPLELHDFQQLLETVYSVKLVGDAITPRI